MNEAGGWWGWLGITAVHFSNRAAAKFTSTGWPRLNDSEHAQSVEIIVGVVTSQKWSGQNRTCRIACYAYVCNLPMFDQSRASPCQLTCLTLLLLAGVIVTWAGYFPPLGRKAPDQRVIFCSIQLLLLSLPKWKKKNSTREVGLHLSFKLKKWCIVGKKRATEVS